jgi:hypothetical protein
MRTTIELPDELLTRAKIQAAIQGVSLKEFFVDALERSLATPVKKVRRPPPVIGNGTGPRITPLTPEQIEAAAFGALDDSVLG